ncbi:MAG: hypothetical protein ACKOWE_02450 [Micrococcales bacterium]
MTFGSDSCKRGFSRIENLCNESGWFARLALQRKSVEVKHGQHGVRIGIGYGDAFAVSEHNNFVKLLALGQSNKLFNLRTKRNYFDFQTI